MPMISTIITNNMISINLELNLNQ